MKLCAKCEINPVRPTRNGNAKYCQACHDIDPHRHGARTAMRAEGEIIVHVDLEGREHPTKFVQTKNGLKPQTCVVSVSLGREDGTSESLWSDNPREIMRWIIDRCSGEWIGRKIVTQGFHFGWDSSVLARDFDPAGMELIQKVGTTAKNAVKLCGRLWHDEGEECLRLHRYNPEHIAAVITEGGEGQVIAWDSKSELAFAITPRRRMYIERRPEGDRFEGWQRVDIHDVGTAFPPPNSLEKVIELWRPDISADQEAAIHWGKAARHHGFIDGTPEQIMAYSEAECVAASKSVRKLLDMVAATTGVIIKPSKLYGAGSVASQVFNHHGVPKRRDTHADGTMMAGIHVNQLPLLDYFGGLIDSPVVGIVRGPVDQEDINSAYPSQMIKIPCMRSGHGTWRRHFGDIDDFEPTGEIGHVLASWDWTDHDTSTGPFDVRLKDGSVRSPLGGYKIWVNLARFKAAVAQAPEDTFAHMAVWWEPLCDCPPPFAWMQALYQKRLDIKAAMKLVPKGSAEWHELNMQQAAVKLVLNSCYGKLAQTRPEPGQYTNLHYASFITGATRAMVAAEAWRLEATGATICYQHTDSELSVDGQPLPDTKTLGGWGQEDPSHDQLLIQSGLSFSLASDRGKEKDQGKSATRGCDPEKFYAAARSWAATVDFTRPPTEWPELVIDQDRMISRRLAVFQGHPERAGCFLPHPLRVKVAGGKRAFYDAVRMPGQPEAWIVPPHEFIPPEFIASLEDIKDYQTQLAKLIAQGEYDDLDTEVTEYG